MLPCLNYSIGLTRSTNPCIIGTLSPEQITELKRVDNDLNLYLDEIEGGLSWQAIKAIDSRSYYEKVTQARDNAIQVMESDLVSALSLRYTKGKKRFTGTIGQKVMTSSLILPQRWQGVRIRPNDNTDAVLSIRKLTGAFNMAGFLNYLLVKVPLNSTVGEVVKTWSTNEIVANNWNAVATFDKTLNPFVEDYQVNDYYLVYNLPANVQPKNNELVCDCSGAESQKPGQFAKVEGVAFDGTLVDGQLTINNLQTDKFAHGLLVEIEINCGASSLFCKEYNNKEEIQMVMAHMLRYKTQNHLIKAILNSEETTRYSTMGKDLLLMNLGIFKNQYESRIPFLIEGIDINESGCFTCKERANQPAVRTILL